MIMLLITQTYSYFQTITKPTRVTSKSATVIDHVWSNNMKNDIKSGILYVYVY